MKPPSTEDTSLATRRLVSRLRFRHLHLLVTLRECGSLRAAASVLNLTQPALSKALGEIEAAFGFALFVRSARGLVATPGGEIAIRGGAALLEELAHLGSEALAEPAVTVLRIGAPPFVAQGTLPAMFKRLLAGEDRIRIQLQEERVPLLVDSLMAGRLDALISSYPTELPEAVGQPLHFEKLFSAQFAVIAPKNHPLTRLARVKWERLGSESWIMPASTSMVRRMMDEAFRREGVLPPTPAIESTSPFTNVRLVTAGLGLSAVPESSLLNAPSASNVGRIRVHPPIAPSPVALIYRSNLASARIRLLRAALGLAIR